MTNKALLVILVGLLALCTTVSAQNKTLHIRAALSIGNEDAYRFGRKTYGGYNFEVGDKWTLRVAAAEPNTPFALCASWNQDAGACVPNFGKTDQNGNWIFSGIFGASAKGAWTEWIKFSSGNISNRISFSVGDTLSSGTLAINEATAGVFHAGQGWALSLKNFNDKKAELCAEFNGLWVSCTGNSGIESTNPLTGTFSADQIGGWTLWMKSSSGTVTNRVAFTVDDAPTDKFTCSAGTLYPSGPNSGYFPFVRYQSDWYPTDPGEYNQVSGRGGGSGNTLEYQGCKGNNSVWLEWEYGDLASVAVRAPWAGQTDRGLKIGDTLERFQTIYPSAHHSVTEYSTWPLDIDVWDNGSLRVAFQKGQVVMMEVFWDLWNYPADDQMDSYRSTIGPRDTNIAWHKWY